MPTPKLLLPITILLIATLVIAACGGDPSTPIPSPPGESQDVSDPTPTHRPGESEWSPPTGQTQTVEPTREISEQPWPQPDL